MKKLSNDGFTLVELMVVVSIIGILSAVAIPNFKSYQAKSKTSEAKLQLASMYSAETALQSDYDAFATCLGYAGYSAPTRGNYYSLGFPAANAVADLLVDNAANSTACATDSGNSGFGVDAFRKVAGHILTVANLSVIAGSYIDAGVNNGISDKTTIGVGDKGDWFIIGAVGIINSSAKDPVTDSDKWLIDENKVLVNVDSGVNL